MINNLIEEQCPSTELLSAYCDCANPKQDLQLAAIAQHVDNCKVCQKIVAAYRQIDLLVHSACQPRDDFADRVLAAVSSSSVSSSDSTPHVWQPPWLRLSQVAAALIFMTVAVAFLLRQGPSSENSPGQLAQNSEGQHIHIVAGQEGVQPTIAIAEENQAEKIDEVHSGRRVQGHEMQTVGVEKNNERKQAPTAQTLLPPEVRHVWSVKNFQQSRKSLEKWAKDDNFSVAWEQKNAQPGRLNGKIELEDSRLQDFVDKLHARGWKLLTAALPQPDNGEKVRFTGKKVAYDLVMVQAD